MEIIDQDQTHSAAVPAVNRELPASLFFGIWLLLAVLATVPFWFTDWDMNWGGAFYQGGQGAGEAGAATQQSAAWASENAPLWKFFYHAAPVLVGLLAFMGLGMAVAGLFKEKWLRLRPMGLYLLLTVILGPGVLVNAISKEYSGRPRPRQVESLGGELKYLPPFKFGKVGEGKSFPCGHCSVGFSFAALWLLVGRRSLWVARLALAGGLTLGILMGIGRMAAGAHFFSDVLWSGLMTMLAAGVTYYYLLRMPARWEAWQMGKTSAPARKRGMEALAFGAVAILLVLGLLLASPVHEDFTYTRANAGDDPAILNLDVGTADVSLTLVDDESADDAQAEASVRGFGLPWNKVLWKASLKKEDDIPNIYVSLQRKGFFTDYEATLDLVVKAEEFRTIKMTQDDGKLAITGSAGALELNLEGVDPKVEQVFTKP